MFYVDLNNKERLLFMPGQRIGRPSNASSRPSNMQRHFRYPTRQATLLKEPQ
jgi:hypothetical protein